ncbi:MAG: hypothetical protein M1836_007949 [Candelina mexicana]|nr:MAG: hypothetical protein M1836_007949 [Candelina mexicana]
MANSSTVFIYDFTGRANKEPIALSNSSVPSGVGVIPFNLKFGQQTSCFFQLDQNGSTAATPLFDIKLANDTSETWFSSDYQSVQSSGSGDAATAIATSVSAAIASRSTSSTAATFPGFTVTGSLPSVSGTITKPVFISGAVGLPYIPRRPSVVLPSDRPGRDYSAGSTDCLNNTQKYAQACWEVLGLNEWLPTWFRETPQCVNASDNMTCNLVPEAWSVTFLREAESSAAPDCISLRGNCQYLLDLNTGAEDDPLLRARYKYVRYSIILIGLFFNSWSVSMDSAINQAGDSEANGGIRGILDIVDPSKIAQVDVSAVLTTLGLSLSFPPGNHVADYNIVDRVTQTIQNHPALANVIWPVLNESPRVGTSELPLNNIKAQFQNNLQEVLSLIQGVNQSDVSLFLALAGGGDFTVPYARAPRVAEGSLARAFNTFLLTSAWAQNNWTALILPGVDAVGLRNGTAKCPSWASDSCISDPDIGCESVYDANGLCEDALWWYSTSQNSTFTLLRNGEIQNADASLEGSPLERSLSQQLVTGSSIFEDAAICEFQNLFTSAGIYDASYSVNSGVAGFVYSGNIPEISQYSQHINGTSQFVPISSDAFVALSKSTRFAPLLVHPGRAGNSNAMGVNQKTLNLYCVSQLSVTVANSWKGSWTANSPPPSQGATQ